MTRELIFYVYGGLMMVGGVMGFLKARSIPSLIAGDVSGILLILCGYFYGHGTGAAFLVGMAITAALIITFALRFNTTKAFMPSGMLAVISVAAIVLLAVTK